VLILCAVYRYDPRANGWLALQVLIFGALCAIGLEAHKEWRRNKQRGDDHEEVKLAEAIWCWVGIGLCLLVLVVSFPKSHEDIFGPVLAAGILGGRLIKLRKT
jgi:hypothetical protein